MTGRQLLKRYMKDAKLRAADVVRAAGFDDGLFSRWLSGDRNPGLRSAAKIERVTGGAVPVSAWVSKK